MIAFIGTALSKFGSWVANNWAVQWVLGVLALIIGLLLWGERREGQGRKQEKLKQKERDLVLREKAEQHVEEIIEEEQENADQALEAGRAAMRDEPLSSDSMSDDEFFYTYGYHRPPRKTQG